MTTYRIVFHGSETSPKGAELVLESENAIDFFITRLARYEDSEEFRNKFQRVVVYKERKIRGEKKVIDRMVLE